MVRVLDETRPRARKTHTCQVCWGTIGVGDAYLRQRNVGDDGPYVFKAHELCWKVSLHIADECGMWTEDGEWPEPFEVRAFISAIFAALSNARTEDPS